MFKKYPKIIDLESSKTAIQIAINENKLTTDTKFVVTEKIHGANLSFWVDTQTYNIKVATRREFLNKKSDFFNYQYVLNTNREKIITVTKNVVAVMSDLSNGCRIPKTVIVYGELCGGYFPNFKSKHPLTEKVQRGVYYSPENEFIAFDIKVILTTPETLEEETYWLDHNTFERVIQGNLHTAPVIAKDVILEEAQNIDPHFDSIVPQLLGYGDLENNAAEGVVIKPMHTIINNGGKRLIMRNKTNRFKEKGRKQKRKEIKELTQDLMVISDTLFEYVNEPRIESAISKIGKASFDNFGEIMKEVKLDSLESFKENDSEIYALYLELKNKDKKRVEKLFTKKAQNILRSYIKTHNE